MGIKHGKEFQSGGRNRWTFERIYKHFPFMEHRANQKGALLSGGEQQMLTIARTLMGNPELLMVDEPTEGLAPVMVEEVRDVLAEINKTGVSILLIEHNLKVALHLAELGCAVTIVEMLPKILSRLETITRKMFIKKLKENLVK